MDSNLTLNMVSTPILEKKRHYSIHEHRLGVNIFVGVKMVYTSWVRLQLDEQRSNA